MSCWVGVYYLSFLYEDEAIVYCLLVFIGEEYLLYKTLSYKFNFVNLICNNICPDYRCYYIFKG